MVKDKGFSSHLMDVAGYLFSAVVLVITLFPFMNIISTSISGNLPVMTGGVGIFPQQVTFEAYTRIFSNWLIPNAFFNSTLYTAANVVYCVFLTLTMAYPLTKKHFIFRRHIWMIVVFTMYFNGGLIPLFLQVKRFGLYNNIGSQVFPLAIAISSLMLLRVFIKDIPAELEESALLDGANNITVFFRIVLPLMLPGIATITLYYFVWKWNDFMNPLIYFKDYDKFPLTVVLRDIVIGGNQSNTTGNFMTTQAMTMADKLEMQANVAAYSERIKYASLIVSIIPIFAMYPVLQKYFIKGTSSGAVKG